MNEDLKYFLVIFLILAGTAAFHNINTTEEKALDLGYCDTELNCGGFEVADFCIGVNYRTTECYEPEAVEDYRSAEARCAVQAYNLCEDQNLEDYEWVDQAEYENKTCEKWEEDYEEFTLLPCDEMSPSVQEWENIR